MAHTGQKGACATAAAADRVLGEVKGSESKGGGGVGRKQGLEDANLGFFYAGARHLCALANCLFGVVETGKGSSKFVYFLTQFFLRFRGFFKTFRNWIDSAAPPVRMSPVKRVVLVTFGTETRIPFYMKILSFMCVLDDWPTTGKLLAFL